MSNKKGKIIDHRGSSFVFLNFDLEVDGYSLTPQADGNLVAQKRISFSGSNPIADAKAWLAKQPDQY